MRQTFNVELENSNIIPQKINRKLQKITEKTTNVSRRYNSFSSGTKSKHIVEGIQSLNTSIQSKKEFLYKYMNKYTDKYAMNEWINK